MRKDADVDMILSNVSIRPNEAAKKTAYERMMKRQAEFLAEQSRKKCKILSLDELEGVAAAGLPPDEVINFKINHEEEN